MLKTRRPYTLASLAVVALLGAACAPTDQVDDSDKTPSAGADASKCTPDALELTTAGTLTVGTDSPAYEPWFKNDDPTNGEGYEAAVAYAVADKLGFAPEQVTWVTVPFNKAVQPGPKDFDLDLNQISITEERRNAVDFSSGYYDVRQTVITNKGSKIAKVSSIADLADAKLGAQVGTTSYDAIAEQIKPSKETAVFDTNDQAVQALKNGQIDGIVVDLPTAYYMTAVQLDDGIIVGQLPAGGGDVEQFGAVLDKGSSLTACVSWAVDELRSEGTLDELVDTWLAQQGGAPELS